MSKVTVIQSGMAGVDMLKNPLFLSEERLAGATNMVFDEGQIKTRPGFRYHDLGFSGPFQGAAVYSPSRGMSHQPFADPYTALVVVAGGSIYYNLSQECHFGCPVEVCGEESVGSKPVNVFQAENYLIVQSSDSPTLWWEGYGKYTISPGLDACDEAVAELLLQADVNHKELVGASIDCCFQKIEYCDVTPVEEQEQPFGSHDSLIFEKHRNFLVSSAGIGIYTNGRIHQESRNGIYVSDLIHKRGTKFTDDILLMEEQQAGSFGEPLSTNSRLGQLRAMEVLPEMNTANGEGALIAYYDNGVVSFDTFAFPRETRVDEDTLEIKQKGWSEVRQVNHLLNRVSATGRYAVAVLPRDHAFRSRYGIHLLKTSLGEGSFNDEYINTLSQDVQPILDDDVKSSLKGTSVGHWTQKNRLLTTVGMVENSIYSSTPMARGFVVWNQAATFTEDRTPRPLWEGLWSVHSEIAGVHRLLDPTEVNGENQFGFVASKGDDASLVFGEIDSELRSDILDGEDQPIEWDITSRKLTGGFSKISSLTDGRLDIVARGAGSKVRVMVRTDRDPEWSEWKQAPTSEGAAEELISINLGKPPKNRREATWFQLRVEGVGHTEIRMLEVEISPDRDKLGKTISTDTLPEKKNNFHRFNKAPLQSRWT